MGERSSVTRRQFLKGALVGVGAAVSPLLLSACGGTAQAPETSSQSTGSESTSANSTNATSVSAEATSAPVEANNTPAPAASSDLKIVTSGWPLTPMPTAEDIEKEPNRKGYATALQTWLDQNPGVTFEQVDVNIWDPQAIVTAISGGTAPLYVFASSVGGWTTAGTRAAFVQGLLADTTPVVEKYGLKQKMTKQAIESWEPYGMVDGKYINYPIDAGLNGTFYYRRDLLKEAGVAEPSLDWTWEDVRAMAKGLTSDADNRKGVGLEKSAVGAMLADHGFDITSHVPAPDTSWNWARDFSDPKYVEVSNLLRAMVFEDKTVFSDASANGEAYMKAFVDGAIAMYQTNILGAFGSSANANSPAALAKRLDKPYQEVFGFAPRPKGSNGFQQGGAYVGGVAFSPDATAELLDKGAGAVDYMFLGKGWDIQKAGQYEATKDLQAVFNYPLPIDGKYTYEGVPGSFADAWGEETLKAAQAIAGIKNPTDRGLFFPAEQNPGPGNEAIDDTWSKFIYVADQMDLAAELKTAQDTWNQQAGGFTSSVDDADFIASAKKYYAELDTYLQQNLPEFYQGTYKPWYESKVAPVLG